MRYLSRSLLGAAALAGLAGFATAEPWWGAVTGETFVIAVRNSSGFARYEIDTLALQNSDQPYRLTMTSATGDIIGEATMTMEAGLPSTILPLNFSFTNASDQEAEVFIGVPNRKFAPIAGASGRADAIVSVTDNNGDGAFANGLFGNNDFYRWDYNGTVPNGTLFQTQVTGPVIAGINATTIAGDNTPVGPGFIAIPNPVSIMSGRVNFTLSAFDTAVGNGTFQIVPSPGAISLAALAGLIVLPRRRR